MSEVRRIGPDDWELFRDIRLRSLADSPDAFGSTLERERAFRHAELRDFDKIVLSPQRVQHHAAVAVKADALVCETSDAAEVVHAVEQAVE